MIGQTNSVLNFRSILADINNIPDYLKKDHLPSLNGFRAVSVLLVVIFHMGLSGNFYYKIIFNGSLGVDVFFVISGFLITTLLIKEKVNTGTISLRLFYIRRVLRILPAAYLCIIVVIILNYFLKLKVSSTYIIAAFFFLVNFKFLDPYKSSLISHYWSLSVEEQFYFLFPFILKKNFKVFVLFIISIVVLLPCVISAQFMVPVLNQGLLFALTHYFIKFQGIAVGCLFAVCCLKNIVRQGYFQKYSIALKIVLTIIIFSLNHTGDVNSYSVFSNLVVSILIGWLLVLNLFYTDDAFYKFLNLKVISQIGVLSYSIYIWHLLIINLGVMPRFIAKFPQNLFFILAAALLSYYGWEKQFLKLKNRFSVIKNKEFNDKLATDS